MDCVMVSFYNRTCRDMDVDILITNLKGVLGAVLFLGGHLVLRISRFSHIADEMTGHVGAV